MTSPIVAVGSLGGTITMTGREGAAVQPRLSAEDLMSSLPGLADSVRIRTRTIATKPGASLSGRTWLQP
jgi:L-asparaginase